MANLARCQIEPALVCLRLMLGLAATTAVKGQRFRAGGMVEMFREKRRFQLVGFGKSRRCCCCCVVWARCFLARCRKFQGQFSILRPQTHTSSILVIRCRITKHYPIAKGGAPYILYDPFTLLLSSLFFVPSLPKKALCERQKI